MKLVSSLYLFLFGFCVVQLHGFVVDKDETLKFLVLQKSDFVKGEVESPTNSPNEEDAVTQGDEAGIEATTEFLEIITENIIESEVPAGSEEINATASEKKIFNPVDAWKELGFPVFPEEALSPANSPPSKEMTEAEMEIANVNITRGRVIGRSSCQCGKSRARIVNGDPARINDIPWTAALVRNGFFGFLGSKKPYCGATLINDRYVVTASHCVDGMFAGGIKVWLNEEDFLIDTESSGNRLEFGVAEIIMHPDYNRRNVDNDIALIKLDRAVPIDIVGYPDTFITPACVPANNDADFSGLNGTVAGWGLTMEGGSQSNVLRKVDVPIITNEKCNSTQTKYTGRISDNMLCAGYDEGGKDACQGDSGGPLIIDNNARNTLVGVVSWGFGCAQPQSPGVYTRVARYSGWILDNTKGANWCEQ